MKKILYAVIFFFCAWFASGCGDDQVGAAVAPNTPSGSGTGGSLARFAIQGNFLYAVDDLQLITFDISSGMEPKKLSEKHIGIGAETIFPMDTLLFIGTQTGMQIFSLQDPVNPEYLSMFQHAFSCDPVVVQDTLAYITLRSDNLCREGMDVLQIIDVRNVYNPKFLSQFQMNNPFGLGISDSILFITEGTHGLKVFDVNSFREVELINELPGLECYDVIPLDRNLIVSAGDGIYQYDFSDPLNLKLSSVISTFVD
jgi:hypothetical protein